jgi:pyruvate dehydrogenase E1 component
MLAALGLAGDVFGERLFPIGTVYDPFIARGLDALNYACYQDARFMLVATPSGVTLGPEGGAHQSINPPLIALGQPGLRHYEPAFVDELALLMEEGFRLMQREDGESVYLRLTTRTLEQVERSDDSWKAAASPAAIGCANRLPAPTPRSSIRAPSLPRRSPPGKRCRTTCPAWGSSPSPHPTCSTAAGAPAAARAGRAARRSPAMSSNCWARSHPTAGLITMIDAAPASLSWLGGVLGPQGEPARHRPLRPDRHAARPLPRLPTGRGRSGRGGRRTLPHLKSDGAGTNRIDAASSRQSWSLREWE